MANHGVEVNKGLVGLAAMCCAVGIATNASVFGWMNPLLAAVIGLIGGFAFAYQSVRNAGIAVFVGIMMFLAAIYAE